MKDDLPVNELEQLAEEDIGEALRRTREYYKKSLDEVEAALRIRSCQIEAIERGDMDALPGRVYAIGFVRSYAEYMQLDGAKVVQLFKEQYMDGNSRAALSFPIPASETKTPSLWIAVISLVLLSAFVYFLNGFGKIDRSLVETIEIVPKEIREHVSKDILVMPSVAEKQVVQVHNTVEDMSGKAPKAGIVLNILGDSWIEIKADDGQVLVSKILTKDDEYFVPDSPGLSMSLGNAANVEILVNGRALKPLGKDGEVRKGIPLNVTYLGTLEFVELPVPEEPLEEEIVEEPASE